MSSRPVLLVEDSDADAEALMRVVHRMSVDAEVVRVHDGESALDYLHRRGTYADARRPALVLMDLHMPGISGHELLVQLRADVGLRTLPIIVFSSSALPADVEGAYAEGANSYMRKPGEREGLERMVRALRDFWFSVALLPGYEERA